MAMQQGDYTHDKRLYDRLVERHARPDLRSDFPVAGAVLLAMVYMTFAMTLYLLPPRPR
jgi:hypothetical protein